MPEAPFPERRLRRLRRGEVIRHAVTDVTLEPANLILPLFVKAEGPPESIASMPGVQRFNPEAAAARIDELAGRGLRQFLLFGVVDPARKDPRGEHALEPASPVARAIERVREAGTDALLYADLCFCEYTDHGHCGVLEDDAALTVANDPTLERLAAQATMLAGRGADVIAPSGMMDGQVGAIRQALDAAGRPEVAIMSYTAKYASSFYGPFREAGGGGMSFGDRRGYQMDPRRSREWRSELEADLAEGADIVMVKPALAYLDVVSGMRRACEVPVAAYHVSGEYAMLAAAAERGWLELEPAVLEASTAIRRAGADLVITYFADRLLAWMN